MNRGYDRAWYLDRIAAIRRILPGAAISTDLIAGFCGESEDDHADTLSLMDEVRYDMAYMFKYSERPRTLAARKYADDVAEDVKGRRLQEIIDRQMAHGLERNRQHVGKVQEVLLEGVSKRSAEHLFGRNGQNAVVIVARHFEGRELMPGDYIEARVLSATSGSLQGEVTTLLHTREALPA